MVFIGCIRNIEYTCLICFDVKLVPWSVIFSLGKPTREKSWGINNLFCLHAIKRKNLWVSSSIICNHKNIPILCSTPFQQTHYIHSNERKWDVNNKETHQRCSITLSSWTHHLTLWTRLTKIHHVYTAWANKIYLQFWLAFSAALDTLPTAQNDLTAILSVS